MFILKVILKYLAENSWYKIFFQTNIMKINMGKCVCIYSLENQLHFSTLTPFLVIAALLMM